MNKQQQLTFDKGITNIPSDALCDDNELEVSENIVYRDGEHQPIQDPVKILSLTNGQLLFVHKPYGSSDKYIVQTYEGDIHWVTKHDDGSEEQLTSHNLLTSDFKNGEVKIEAIGNMLIISDEKNIGYFKWTSKEYKNLGSVIPEPKVEFKEYNSFLYDKQGTKLDDGVAYRKISGHPLSTDVYEVIQRNWVSQQYIVGWENYVIGNYAAAKNDVSGQISFYAPFFVCVAVELYDGSYILHSAPVLMLPSIRRNFFIKSFNSVNTGEDTDVVTDITFSLRCAEVGLKADFDYSDYGDLVKGVKLFITDQTEINKTYSLPNADMLRGEMLHDGIDGGTYTKEDGRYHNFYPGYRAFWTKEDKEIIEDLQNNSIFYKVADLGTKRNDEDFVSFRNLITGTTLLNLTTQERLSNDYFSHTQQIGLDVDSYNNRLVYSGIKRTLYEGYKHFMGISNLSGNKLTVYVRIESQDGERIVKTEMWNPENVRYYFYYPDPKAKEVRAYDNGMCVFRAGLVEHNGLNGAYYLTKLPTEGCNEFAMRDTGGEYPVPVEDASPTYINQIMFSEVDNPFVFTARGVVGFGTGELLALTTTTQALSQGQFGQYPLLAFTTEGIWAVTIDDEGYPASSVPMSREVLVKGGPLVNTDGAVFFATKKGLMMIVGNDVRCVSEQLMGDFPKRLKDSIIAYDYRDSLLWIVPKSSVGNEITTYCYVYNIKTGTFHTSKYFMPTGQGEEDVKYPFFGIITVDISKGERKNGKFVRHYDGEEIPANIYTEEKLKQQFEAFITPSVYSLTRTRYIVFDNRLGVFLEKNGGEYTIDGRNQSDWERYYRKWGDNDQARYAYNLNTLYKYQNEFWQYNQELELVKTKFAFSVVEDRVNPAFILGDTHPYTTDSAACADLKQLIETSTTKVEKITITNKAVSYIARSSEMVNNDYVGVNRFCLMIYARCVIKSGNSTRSEAYKLFYTSWPNNADYVDGVHPPVNVLYIDRNGSGYKWDGTSFNEVMLPFVGTVNIYDVSVIYPNMADLYDVVDELGDRQVIIRGVMFDSQHNRFYQACDVWLNGDFYGTFYIESWVNNEKYVDSEHDGHPLQSYTYSSQDEEPVFLNWDGNNVIITPILPFYSFVTTDPQTDTLEEGPYNEETLKAQLLQGATVRILDFKIEEDEVAERNIVYSRYALDEIPLPDPEDPGGIIRLLNYDHFGYLVSYSYYWQGEKHGRLFFTDFDGAEHYVDNNNYGHPLPYTGHVIYRLYNRTYYRWNPEVEELGKRFESTFAGLSGVVNSYPDTLFQKLGDGIYSLMERPQPTDDENTYNGVIMTRPMKLENALALKSIMQLRNICQMDGTIVLSIWGSNDLRSWVKLRAFRNAPWKYYRFRFEFSNMPATDRFAGTVLITQERRTNKLR